MRSSRHAWPAVAAALSAAGWGANQFTPLAVVYRTREGWPTVPVVVMFTMYLVGLVPGLLLGGAAADRFGRRRVVCLALAATAAASALLALAPITQQVVYASRLTTGAAAGLLLSAATVWLQELCESSGRDGARTAMYATGAGFASGALVGGVVAEWAPAPMVAPPLLHTALTTAVLLAARRVPDTSPAGPPGTPPSRRHRWGVVLHPRFVLVVLPASPAAFAAATVAYVVLPPLVVDRVHGHAPLFGGLAAGVTIAMGIAVQPLALRLDSAGSARSTLVAMATVVAGLLVAADAVLRDSALTALGAAVVLGAGYGLTLASGLKEVERLTPDRESSTASSVYQGATHSGFLTPLLLAVSAGAAPYPALLAGLAALGVLFLALTARYSRRNLPARPGSTRPAPHHRTTPHPP
ncbi:MFS transporter, partial [Streptomyces polyrhachis]